MRVNLSPYLPSMGLTVESTGFGCGSGGGEAPASGNARSSGNGRSSGSLSPHDGQNLKPCCNFEPH